MSLPELRIGAETAAAYLNEHGGANGRPLEIVPCNVDGTPEKSIDCANQLVGDGVSVIMEGYDPSSDAMLPVLESAGIAAHRARRVRSAAAGRRQRVLLRHRQPVVHRRLPRPLRQRRRRVDDALPARQRRLPRLGRERSSHADRRRARARRQRRRSTTRPARTGRRSPRRRWPRTPTWWRPWRPTATASACSARCAASTSVARSSSAPARCS